MAALGTTACIEMCRHCTYDQIYVPDMRETGQTPLNYDNWLVQIWLPFVDERLSVSS